MRITPRRNPVRRNMNLCEASATKAVKGRASRGLAVPAMEGSAWTEPSKKALPSPSHNAHLTMSLKFKG